MKSSYPEERRSDGAERDAAAAADLRPHEAGHIKLRALALTNMGQIDQAEKVLALECQLPSDPVIATRGPVLPPEFGWVSEKLSPTED